MASSRPHDDPQLRSEPSVVCLPNQHQDERLNTRTLLKKRRLFGARSPALQYSWRDQPQRRQPLLRVDEIGRATRHRSQGGSHGVEMGSRGLDVHDRARALPKSLRRVLPESGLGGGDAHRERQRHDVECRQVRKDHSMAGPFAPTESRVIRRLAGPRGGNWVERGLPRRSRAHREVRQGSITRVGTRRGMVVPSPSWPTSLFPQQ